MLFRWIGFAVVFAGYVTRVYLVNGWFIVTYGLGIFLLNQLIGFLSPQVPPCAAALKTATDQRFQFDPEENDIDTGLPVKESDEFR